mgnify:FL=1
MYGINPLTNECAYKTPCGWCARLDKECTKNKGYAKDNDYIKNKEYAKNKEYIRNKTKIDFTGCTYYDDGKCLGTKELDPCEGINCGRYKE